MNLCMDDINLLKELCEQNEVDTEKILKLLRVVKEYEFKDRRIGVYDELKDIIKNSKVGGK